MAAPRTRLADVARVIRSKNAGPFALTLDIIFRDRQSYIAAVSEPGGLSRERFAALYGCPLADVGPVIHYEPALAVKVTLRRALPSGSFGDSDVYGAQQHAPMLAHLTVPAPDADEPVV